MNYRIVTGADIDWRKFRDSRLMSLMTDPDSFSGSLEEQKSHPDEYWIARVEKMHAGVEEIGFFMEDEVGDYVAFCRSHRAIKGKQRHVVSFGVVYVRPDSRGHGFARMLMGQTFDFWRADPTIRKFSIEVVAVNVPAVRLYESFGFRAIGTRREELFASDGGYLDTLMMELLIRDMPPRLAR